MRSDIPPLSRRIRTFAFHLVSELGMRYRTSPAVAEGEPRLSKGPHAGDRLPDATVRDGQHTYLQHALDSPHMHTLLCGLLAEWSRADVIKLTEGSPEVLTISYLIVSTRTERSLIRGAMHGPGSA